jgi:hypothetical protein
MGMAGKFADGVQRRSATTDGSLSAPGDAPVSGRRMGASKPLGQSDQVAESVAAPGPAGKLALHIKNRPALAQLIETNIIPRLISEHGEHECAISPDHRLDLEVEGFTEATLAEQASVAMDYFADLVHRGFLLDTLFERLVVPAALRLGEMWERDARDFLDVSRGMDHIQQIILAHSSVFCTDGKVAGDPRRILLVTLPQERHRLGLCLVRAQFWREGWDVCCGELQFINDLESLVRATRFDAIGLSAGRVGDAQMLAHSLARVRKASLNRGLLIIAGGLAFERDDGLRTAIGVDAVASSARDGVVTLRRILDQRANGTA